MRQKFSKADELFYVVDEDDNPRPPLPRRLVHGCGVWHRVAHVWLLNDKKQVLCQQRSFNKEMNPGFWETFFGGHVQPGERYAHAARRELGEELAIDIRPGDMRLWKIFKFRDPTGNNNEFQAIFVTRWSGMVSDVRFDDGEVAQVRWVDIQNALSRLRRKGGTSWTLCGYEIELLQDLQ